MCVWVCYNNVVSWWNIASCCVWTAVIYGKRWARSWFFEKGPERWTLVCTHVQGFIARKSESWSLLLWSLLLIKPKSEAPAGRSPVCFLEGLVFKCDVCKWLIYPFWNRLCKLHQIAQWRLTQWHSLFIWYKSNTIDLWGEQDVRMSQRRSGLILDICCFWKL